MKRYIYSSMNSELDSEGSIVPEDIAYAFRNSKIRNRKGQLIVCYHGTNADFAEFKEDFISDNSGNIGWFGKGFYFSDSQRLSRSYGSILKKCYLNIVEPFVYSSPDSIYVLLDLGVSPRVYEGHLQPYAYLENDEPIEEFTRIVKEAGYDGVKFNYRQGKYKGNVVGTSNSSEYVCFNANQVYVLNNER